MHKDIVVKRVPGQH